MNKKKSSNIHIPFFISDLIKLKKGIFSGSAFIQGDAVYWDKFENIISTNKNSREGENLFMGYAAEDAADSDEFVLVATNEFMPK